ncbi:MAG: triose-phosphate isomerase [bacterium]
MDKIILGNWKSNPSTIQAAIKLAEGVDGVVFRTDHPPIVAVAPPNIFLWAVKEVMEGVALAAQDVFWEDVGAYTGAISWRQLRAMGVTYVIIGHSERRNYFTETDAMCNRKIRAVLHADMAPVLCVGEPMRRGKTERWIKGFVKKQLISSLSGITEMKQQHKLIVAYEPVWAIGNENSDTPEDAVEMILYIKEVLVTLGLSNDILTLYGGSVNSLNIEQFLFHECIGGALVGGASLKLGEFRKIIEKTAQLEKL